MELTINVLLRADENLVRLIERLAGALFLMEQRY